MKTLAKFFLTFLAGAAVSANAMDADGWASIFESIAAFEDRTDASAAVCPGCFNRPGYVKPIVDNLGNVLNSNWYISANVPQSIVFEIGLPVALIPIGDDDRNFTENGVSVPTIFGDHGNPLAYDGKIYGNETLNGLGVFTYPYLQLGFSMFHARVAVRGMLLPPVSELRKFNLLGFGLQYSFGRWFQYMLPRAAQGLDVSLVFGYNSSSIGYRPKDYSGQLDLDISATTFDVVIGYKPFKFFEVLMTLGYQSATMDAGGSLTCETLGPTGAPEGYFGQTINPNLSVKGNSGFKFGLEIALQLGKSYHPVVGFDYSGKSSFTINALYIAQQFGEDKTPDEIAKDKGYVRGAKESKEEGVKEADENVISADTDENDISTDAGDGAPEDGE